MECAGHCNGGEHTSAAMQEEVGWLGSREWMARDMEKEKDKIEEYKEREKSTIVGLPPQMRFEEIYHGNEEYDWAEIAPLPRGGKGKTNNRKRVRDEREEDDQSKQQGWVRERAPKN